MEKMKEKVNKRNTVLYFILILLIPVVLLGWSVYYFIDNYCNYQDTAYLSSDGKNFFIVRRFCSAFGKKFLRTEVLLFHRVGEKGKTIFLSSQDLEREYKMAVRDERLFMWERQPSSKKSKSPRDSVTDKENKKNNRKETKIVFYDSPARESVIYEVRGEEMKEIGGFITSDQLFIKDASLVYEYKSDEQGIYVYDMAVGKESLLLDFKKTEILDRIYKESPSLKSIYIMPGSTGRRLLLHISTYVGSSLYLYDSSYPWLIPVLLNRYTESGLYYNYSKTDSYPSCSASFLTADDRVIKFIPTVAGASPRFFAPEEKPTEEKSGKSIKFPIVCYDETVSSDNIFAFTTSAGEISVYNPADGSDRSLLKVDNTNTKIADFFFFNKYLIISLKYKTLNGDESTEILYIDPLSGSNGVLSEMSPVYRFSSNPSFLKGKQQLKNFKKEVKELKQKIKPP